MSTIVGISVNGTPYLYDYDYLDNKPASLPSTEQASVGDALIVNDSGEPEWGPVVPAASSEYSGMALVVNQSGYMEWQEIVPASDSSNQGQFLMSAGDSGVEWASPLPYMDGYVDGYFLKVEGGQDGYHAEWAEMQSEIPSYEDANNGQVLAVIDNGGTNELAWESVIPVASSEDYGKALVVDDSGTAIWGNVLPEATSSGMLMMSNSSNQPEWTGFGGLGEGCIDCILCTNSSGEAVWRTVAEVKAMLGIQ